MENARKKAISLKNKYYKLFSVDLENTISEKEAIECAKITVDEIIENTPMYLGNLNPKWSFWQEVKNELNNM